MARRAPLQQGARRFIFRAYGKALFQLFDDERWQIDGLAAGGAQLRRTGHGHLSVDGAV